MLMLQAEKAAFDEAEKKREEEVYNPFIFVIASCLGIGKTILICTSEFYLIFIFRRLKVIQLILM